MSDTHETRTGIVVDLEELFLSREFERRPVCPAPFVQPRDEPQSARLEQGAWPTSSGTVFVAATRIVEESGRARC